MSCHEIKDTIASDGETRPEIIYEIKFMGNFKFNFHDIVFSPEISFCQHPIRCIYLLFKHCGLNNWPPASVRAHKCQYLSSKEAQLYPQTPTNQQGFFAEILHIPFFSFIVRFDNSFLHIYLCTETPFLFYMGKYKGMRTSCLYSCIFNQSINH